MYDSSYVQKVSVSVSEYGGKSMFYSQEGKTFRKWGMIFISAQV